MTLTEIFAKAGLNTLLGMGTVFAMLIFISCVISLFRFLPEAGKNDGKTPAASREKPAVSKEQGNAEDPALIAVIAAAVAAASKGEPQAFAPEESPYVVRSIRRIKK